MTDKIEKELRRSRRFAAFMAAAFHGMWEHRTLPRQASRADCAEWLHRTCGRGLRAIDVELSVYGSAPTQGLIVSNHLSYLDILAYSAAVPCVFVSKAEVERWPLFGRYARESGAVFVRRHDRADAARANASVGQSLNNGVPVMLFPEGTTTDGTHVLRFHSTMLQPAINVNAPITPCAIGYELEDGDVSHEVCWWGDMTLVPHVLNLLSKSSIRAKIAFGEPELATGDRKRISGDLHAKVAKLYDELRNHDRSSARAGVPEVSERQ